MTKISMKALLGAASLAVIAAVSLTPAAHAQGQPGTMNGSPQPMMGGPAQPGPIGPNGYPNGYGPQPNGYAPQQNAYVPPSAAEPTAIPQMETRYPGPKVN